GIRDRTVTGVQTCALPIWLLRQVDQEVARVRNRLQRARHERLERCKRRLPGLEDRFFRQRLGAGGGEDQAARPVEAEGERGDRRSEERRVGREGGSGGAGG